MVGRLFDVLFVILFVLVVLLFVAVVYASVFDFVGLGLWLLRFCVCLFGGFGGFWCCDW